MINLAVGDRLIFEKKGPLAGTLAPALKLLVEPDWDMWGWHMATVTRYNDYLGEWMILEAVWPRVREVPLSQFYKGFKVRVYSYLNDPIDPDELKKFVDDVDNAKYDWFVYVLTVCNELCIKFLKWYPPRLLNSKYMCWELSEEFDCKFGTPWKTSHAKAHRYPLITNFLLRSNPVYKGEMVV